MTKSVKYWRWVEAAFLKSTEDWQTSIKSIEKELNLV
jgi:hypothetical protein